MCSNPWKQCWCFTSAVAPGCFPHAASRSQRQQMQMCIMCGNAFNTFLGAVTSANAVTDAAYQQVQDWIMTTAAVAHRMV